MLTPGVRVGPYILRRLMTPAAGSGAQMSVYFDRAGPLGRAFMHAPPPRPPDVSYPRSASSSHRRPRLLGLYLLEPEACIEDSRHASDGRFLTRNHTPFCHGAGQSCARLPGPVAKRHMIPSRFSHQKPRRIGCCAVRAEKPVLRAAFRLPGCTDTTPHRSLLSRDRSRHL